jgi:outer membrane protein TolC
MNSHPMTRLKLIAISFVLCVLTVGCAKYVPQPLSAPENVSALEVRTLSGPALKQFLESTLGHEITPWPPKSWDFQMLALAACYYHPDLEVARVHWEVTKAGIITAGEYPNPSIGFTPQVVTNSSPPWVFTSTTDIPIVTAGKIGYRKAQAKRLAETARMSMVNTAWQVRSRVRSALLSLYAATQTEDILREQRDVQEANVSLLEQRLANGEVSQPEVTLAHIALNQTRLSLHDAQQRMAEARVGLAEALGLQVNALDGVNISYGFLERTPSAKDLPSADMRRQSLVGRPDILSTLQEYAASESALQLEIANQYPDIHITPGYEWDQGNNKWTVVGLALTLPVFNQNKGPIAEAEAKRTEAAARFNALQAQVIAQIDRAEASYGAVLQRVETAESILTAQRKQLQSVQAMLRAGAADRLAVLGAELELKSAELGCLDAYVKLQEAFGLVEDAVQRPLDSSGAVPAVPEIRPKAEEKKGATGRETSGGKR